MKVMCPNCGSGQIRSVDVVQVTNHVTRWTKDESDELTPVNFSGGTVHWDSTTPADPSRPYDCAPCLRNYAAHELVVVHEAKR